MKAYSRMLRNYVNFSGNTSRGDFWKAALVHAVATAVLWSVSVATGMNGKTFDPIVGGYSLFMALPFLAMIVRRLRDAGKSIANLLWPLLPLIGQVILIVKLAAPSAR